MIANISKQLVVVIAIVGAAIPASVSAQLPGQDLKRYFDGTYSVSDCPRPQVRHTISETMGMKIPPKTSACGEYLNKELLNEIWTAAISYSRESDDRCWKIKGAVHAPSWYQFRCYTYARSGYGSGARCEIANKMNYVSEKEDPYRNCYR